MYFQYTFLFLLLFVSLNLYSVFIYTLLCKGIHYIFNFDFNMLNLEYERHHDSLIILHAWIFVH